MRALLALAHFLLIPAAHAGWLQQLGTADPGVRKMWFGDGTILGIANVFPHANLGASAPAVIGLRIAQFVLGTIAAVAVALVIYAGIVLTVSQGEKLEESKKIIRNVAIGLIAAMLADTIILFVLKFMIAATMA